MMREPVIRIEERMLHVAPVGDLSVSMIGTTTGSRPSSDE
jgi:hypothetical protein